MSIYVTHLVIHPNQMAKYLKKKKIHTHTHTKKLKEVKPDTKGERERERSERTSMESTSMELADRPDLAPVRDRGQRQQWAEKRSEGGWVGICGFQDFLDLLF